MPHCLLIQIHYEYRQCVRRPSTEFRPLSMPYLWQKTTKMTVQWTLQLDWCDCVVDVVAWWLRRRTSMLEVGNSIPAQVRPHSNTLRQGMNPWLLLDCTESGSIGAQNVQHLEICWRFNGGLSPGGNVRLVTSCEWLPQPVQDYKPIPLPFTL